MWYFHSMNFYFLSPTHLPVYPPITSVHLFLHSTLHFVLSLFISFACWTLLSSHLLFLSFHLPFTLKGQAACPCSHSHGRGVQEWLCSRTPEIQQGTELPLLHRHTAAPQCKANVFIKTLIDDVAQVDKANMTYVNINRTTIQWVHTSMSGHCRNAYCERRPFNLCCEQKLQGMDERRIQSLADGYCKFSDIEKKVLPIISKCLEGISAAGTKVNEKQASVKCLSCFFLSGLESSPRKHNFNFKQNFLGDVTVNIFLLSLSAQSLVLGHFY